MTSMRFPVLASVALLGACSYEVSFGGSSGKSPNEAANEVMKKLAQKTFGEEPTAVRCPAKLQLTTFQPIDCEVDVAKRTHPVVVELRWGGLVRAVWKTPMLGNEMLAEQLAPTFGGAKVDCTGVVVTPTQREGECTVSGERVRVWLNEHDEFRVMLVPHVTVAR